MCLKLTYAEALLWKKHASQLIADAEAFVLYFARNNPLDRFYAANLDICLKKALDDLVVNPENEELVEKHLPSLLFETPALTDNAPVLGLAMECAARKKVESGAKPVKTGRWRPHHSLNFRGGGTGMFLLKEGGRELPPLYRTELAKHHV